MVTFWGERYRDYFVDLFLPSMLAPNNLPLLRPEDGHRFFIATTRQDWHAINKLPIMHRLRRHAEPSWVEINEPPTTEATDAHTLYAAVIRHMHVCQRKLLEAGYHPSAYGSLHFPDTIFCDGMVAALLRSVQSGHQLVLCPALRQTEEAVIADLEAAGLLSAHLRPSVAAQELTIPSRLAADLAVRHLHPEMAVFQEGACGQPMNPPFRYWRTADGRGIILHTFFTIPVLMDYSVLRTDHTRCLDDDLVENIYVSANFRNCNAIHVVQDSDEFLMLSVTPRATNHSSRAATQEVRRSGLRQEYDRLCNIRRSFEFYVLRNSDVVRRDLFWTRVRWHANELDDNWTKEERRIERVLNRAVGDYIRGSPLAERSSFNWRTLLLDQSVLSHKLREIGIRVLRAAYGDPISRNWMIWQIRLRWCRLLGDKNLPPRQDSSK
jgi:hypothetical protein